MVTEEKVDNCTPVLTFFCSHLLVKTSHVMLPGEQRTISLGEYIVGKSTTAEVVVKMGQRKETIRKCV